MTLDELEKLKYQNEERIKMIEQKYFLRRDELRNVKEICQEKAELRETKEKHVDSSLSYPTYGRGIDPNPTINTYMINSSLCQEASSPNKRRQKNDNDDANGSRKKSKAKRPKIISPRRQKFETQFEKFFV